MSEHYIYTFQLTFLNYIHALLMNLGGFCLSFFSFFCKIVKEIFLAQLNIPSRTCCAVGACYHRPACETISISVLYIEGGGGANGAGGFLRHGYRGRFWLL